MDSAGAVPRALWLVTAVHVMLLISYSVLVPTFRAPDELLYVDHMHRLAGLIEPSNAGRDGAGPTVAPWLAAARDSSPAYRAGAPPTGITDAIPPGERPTFAELAATLDPDAPAPGAPAAEAGVPAPARAETNPVALRPPLASWFGAAVLAAADAVLPGWPWSFDRTVALLRLVDVAVMATVPLLAWAAARRFGCPPQASLTAAVAVLAIPQLTHVSSVVGNDALVVSLAAVVFLLGARVVTGDSSRRTAVLAGVVCGLAILAGGSALVLLAWMVVAYRLAPRRGGREAVAPTPAERRRRRGRPLIVMAVALVVGGWWHLRHLVSERGLQIGLDLPPSVGPGAGSGLVSRLLADVWGAFGWREAVLPTPAVVVATALLLATLGVAFGRGRVRAVRLRLALLVAPAAVLAVLAVAAAAWATLFGDAPLRVEGRVVLVGVVGLCVVAAVGLDQLRSTPTRGVPAVVFVAAMGLHLLAVAAITPRYWMGASPGERLRAVLAFSPWPPALVFVAAVAGLGIAAWTLVELGRNALRPDEAPTA